MVTDTAMVRKNGRVYAFGPVVRELDVFHELFRSIEWIGFDRPDLLDDPVLLPVPDYVQCFLLKRSGGHSILSKLGVLFQTPAMAWRILKSLKGKQVIHTRAPSSPAFIAAFLSFLFRKKIWWHKYAGNWGEVNPPFFYGLQRWWLARASWSKVTINGRWPGQPAHCLSFENPCLDEDERQKGLDIIQQKDYGGLLNLCFVGRIEEEKGIMRLLQALARMNNLPVGELHIIGTGPLMEECRRFTQQLSIKVTFHGSKSREAVGTIMQSCHLIVLPTVASEGFPKVIAEGANYGCVPVVSDISSIAQYVVHEANGFLLSPERLGEQLLQEELQKVITHPNLKYFALAAHGMAGAFTFSRYLKRISKEILLQQ